MDYEKKYKEALERAKALYSKGAPDSLHLEEMFPELAESEEEKIRSFLIDYIKVCRWTEKKDQGWPLREECIAWLEKQVSPQMVADAYLRGCNDTEKKWLEKQSEQKSAWSEEDSKRIDRICNFIWKNRKGDTDEIYQQEQDVKWLELLKDRLKGEQA